MKVKVLLFGQAAEVFLSDEVSVLLNDKSGLFELKEKLHEENEKLKTLNLKWAVNQELVNSQIELKDGDEIAVLPPFAGG